MKDSSDNIRRPLRLLAGLALMAAGLSVGVPAQADPPPWAPAHGYRAKQEQRERDYRYVYYPARQVYYAPDTGVWYWMTGGDWRFGVHLPSQFQATISSGVPVMLHNERPYVEHVRVEQEYGRPWREKHKKEKHKHKEHKHKDKHKHDKHDHDDDGHGRGHGHGHH